LTLQPIRIKTKAELDVIPRMLPSLAVMSADIQGQLSHVIQRYDIRDESRCGLKDCPASHKHGVIFMLTNGSLLRMGHTCGATHFSDVFHQKLDDYDKNEKRQADFAILHETFQQRSDFRSALDATIASNSRVRSALTNLQHAIPALRKAVLDTLRTNGGVVITRHRRSDQEIERLKSIGTASLGPGQELRFEERRHGRLMGASCLTMAQDLTPRELKAQLEAFLLVEEYRTLTKDRLETYAEYCRELPHALARSQQFIDEAEKFISLRNRQLIAILLKEQGERSDLSILTAHGLTFPMESGRSGSNQDRSQGSGNDSEYQARKRGWNR
jgi:hypothetical protein